MRKLFCHLTVHFNVGSFHPYQPLCNAIMKDIIQLLLLLLLLDYYNHYLYHYYVIYANSALKKRKMAKIE